MEISSVHKLCQHLISSAIRRCRMSEDLCRLSVVIKPSPPLSDPPITRISISDTGSGSSLEEFHDLKLTKNCASADIWDGFISVTTTNIFDKEIFQYHLNLKEATSARKLMKLPSLPKNGSKFSGSEVSLSMHGTIDDLVAEITPFFQKLQILKIPKVAIELVVESGETPGSHSSQFIIADDCILTSSNIECLKSGFEDYVYRHRNIQDKKCLSCFPSCDNLRVGSGIACSTRNQKSTGLVIEAVMVISEMSEPSTPCSTRYNAKSEVPIMSTLHNICLLTPKKNPTTILYFRDFALHSIPQSALNAMSSIDWKSYGLTLKSILEGDGHTLIVWENLPSNTRVDIVLHCYHEEATMPAAREKMQVDRHIIRKAIKLALADLKEKHTGSLLSARAHKICSHAPHLARTIAGLILSSNDSTFQGECLSVLGLQSQYTGGDILEDCIKQKIVSVIEMNDRKPRSCREAKPLIFEDDYCYQEPDFEEEYEDEEASYTQAP